MKYDQAGTQLTEPKNTDEDAYPDFAGLLRQLLNDDLLPEGPIERLEVTALATGQALYKVWPARAETELGGVLKGAN